MARSGAVNERITLPSPDYEADDVLVVREPEQLRALGDDLRSRLVILLRDRAYSTTELATKLGLPKGTVGHHVKVLEKAGLVQVVRTRQVRALTEKLYGRTARLFLFDDGRTTLAVVTSRLLDADARRLSRRLEKLIDDFRAADNESGQPFGLAAALYLRSPDA
ncbi:MAG: ArsR/SmtB family transcription factor [Gaiellaceae bacterium]